MSSERLKREELIKIVQENLREKEYSKIINLLEEKINQYNYSEDNRFYTFGRRDFVIQEFDNNILEKNIANAYGNLQDIIYCDDFLPINVRDEIKNKGLDYNKVQDDMNNYKKEGYVCLEEKEIIVKMINQINGLIEEEIKNKQ